MLLLILAQNPGVLITSETSDLIRKLEETNKKSKKGWK